MKVENQYTDRFLQSYSGYLPLRPEWAGLALGIAFVLCSIGVALAGAGEKFFTPIGILAACLAGALAAIGIKLLYSLLRMGQPTLTKTWREYRTRNIIGYDAIFMLKNRPEKLGGRYYPNYAGSDPLHVRWEPRNQRLPECNTSEFTIYLQLSGRANGPMIQVMQNGVPISKPWVKHLVLSNWWDHLEYQEVAGYPAPRISIQMPASQDIALGFADPDDYRVRHGRCSDEPSRNSKRPPAIPPVEDADTERSREHHAAAEQTRRLIVRQHDALSE